MSNDVLSLFTEWNGTMCEDDSFSILFSENAKTQCSSIYDWLIRSFVLEIIFMTITISIPIAFLTSQY